MKRGARRATATLLPVIRDELLAVRRDMHTQARGSDGADMRKAAAEVGVTDLLGVLMTEGDAIREAQLWFVTWEMTLLAAKAAESLPDWSPQETRPAPSGILVWERGTGLTAPWSGAPLGPPKRGAYGQAIRTEVSIDGVLWFGAAEGLVVNGLTADPRALALAGRGHILTDIASEPVVLDEAGHSAHGVRIGSLLAATWLLADQPTVGERRMIRGPGVGPDRPELPSDITVVDLRMLAGADGLHEPQSGNRQVEHDHRWLVRGHWRQQPYGPGHELRRPTWVVPHLKGPADAPIKITDQVMVWRR